MAYKDALGNIVGLDMPTSDVHDTGSNYPEENFDDVFGESDMDRAAELKKKELFRKGKLEYEDNGELIHDSNAMIRAKEVANAGIRGTDWLLEASENLVDFGQGEWIGHYDGFMAENEGKRYSMDNKDFIAARGLGDDATGQLVQQYKNATHDDNADKGIYTLRKFDGYNADGSTKYIYKYGLAEVGADARYRDQYVQDGFEIVEEKRFAGAEDWEKTWNASQGVLDARVLDNSIDLVQDAEGNMVTRDVASGIGFGAGKTELLNRDLLGTDVGKTQEDYDQNRAYSERLSKMADARWQSGMSDSVIDAVQSGAAKTLVDTADFVLDVITPFGDNTLLNGVKKQENIDKWVGYDRTQSTQALSDAATFWNQGEYLDAIKMVVTDPNTMAESIPMMIGMVAGSGKFTMASKAIARVAEAKKAGESVSKIAQLELKLRQSLMLDKNGPQAVAMYDKYKDAPAKLKLYDHFAKNAGFHTIVGAMTNNVLDDRIAAKKEAGEAGSVDIGEVLGVYALQLPLLAIDRMSFKAILGMGAEGKALKTAFGSLEEAGKKQVLTAVAKKGAEMVAAGAGEGVQEYMQTWGEILGSKAFVGGDSVSDVFGDAQNQREALMGGLGGLGAGVQMHGLSHTVPDVARGGIKAYDKFMEDDTVKAMRKVKSVEDFDADKTIPSSLLGEALVNQIIEPEVTKLSDFNIDNMGSFVQAMDVVLNRRMQNAFGRDGTEIERGYQINEILSRSLDGAILKFTQDKDQAKLDRVLAFIKRVNDDSTINFNSKEIAKERNNDLLNKFIEISNKEYKAKNAGADSGTATGNEELNKRNEDDIEKQKQADLMALFAEIKSEIAVQTLYSQGSSVNMDEDGNVITDEKGIETGDGISSAKLAELVSNYIEQGGKNYQQVSDEIQKFGYITYNKNNNKTNGISIKPSMRSYDDQLAKEFRSSENINLSLTPSVKNSTKATFARFVNWSQSRAEKLGTNSGKGSSWTAKALSNMDKENVWFKTKIKMLQGMLDSHAEDAVKGPQREALQTELDGAKNNLVSAEKRMAEHKQQLQKYVTEVLGLEGVDLNNPEHVRKLAGVQTNYGKQSDGKTRFGPFKVKKRNKDNTLEESQRFMRENLLREPEVKGLSGFKGFDNSNVEFNEETDLSHTAGSKKTKPKAKSETAPNSTETAKTTIDSEGNVVYNKPLPQTEGISQVTLPFEYTIVKDWDTREKTKVTGESLYVNVRGRVMTLVEINGVKVPFYISTGSGGKKSVKTGKWYPFFGISNEGWQNKLGEKEINDYYGSQELRQVAKLLDDNIGDISKNKTVAHHGGQNQAMIDLINTDMNPTENEHSQTRIIIEQNIEDILKKIQVKKDSKRAETEHKTAQDLLKKTKYGIVEDMTEEEYLNAIEEVVRKGTSSTKPEVRKKWRQVYAALARNEIYASRDADSTYYKDVNKQTEPEVNTGSKQTETTQTELEQEVQGLYEDIVGHTDVVVNDVIDYMSKIEVLLKDYDVDGKKYQKEFGTIADKMGQSLAEDKKTIEELYADYKELRDEKKDQNQEKKEKNERDMVGAGMIKRIVEIVKKINKNMKALKARFVNKVLNTELKKMVKKDFEDLSGNVYTGSELAEEIKKLEQTYRYIQTSKSKYNKMSKADKLDFFGVEYATTLAEYPVIETFFKTVNKLVGRFGRGKTQEIYEDARRKYSDEDIEEINETLVNNAQEMANYEAEKKRREKAENAEADANSEEGTIDVSDINFDDDVGTEPEAQTQKTTKELEQDALETAKKTAEEAKKNCK